jgi:NAD(P)-dependent dehydrogenase (short-subunit alcohol dehydrogenase family)
MADALRLYGLKAVVTAAADGIGEAVARTFAKHGAEVLAVDTAESGVDSALRRVKGIVPLIAEDDQSPIPVITVRERLAGLDILVNNYAGPVDAAAGAQSEQDALLEAMLERISATSAAMADLLKKSPAGRIINIGCLRSSFGRDGGDRFAASEQALAGVTASLAAEYGKHGITANYIQPGAVMTSVSRSVFDADKQFRDWCIASSAAKRLGEPIDIAKVALFLATDDAVFVSGTGITVDGGSARNARG